MIDFCRPRPYTTESDDLNLDALYQACRSPINSHGGQAHESPGRLPQSFFPQWDDSDPLTNVSTKFWFSCNFLSPTLKPSTLIMSTISLKETSQFKTLADNCFVRIKAGTCRNRRLLPRPSPTAPFLAIRMDAVATTFHTNKGSWYLHKRQIDCRPFNPRR